MEIYLPIAEMPVSMLLILAMGVAVGFISGMFGVGGGFLMTPLLIFIGVPPTIAVGTVSTHMAASSFSGVLSYWRKKLLDVPLGLMLLAGGMLGTAAGVWLFNLLKALGQIDLTIGITYVTLLTIIGGMMLRESLTAMLRKGRGDTSRPKPKVGQHAWFLGLPLKMRFRRSGIYVSAIPVWIIGFGIGFLGALMGIGGGFLLVPALIYILRVPTTIVLGTSLLLTLCTMLMATVMHATSTHSIDVVLALILMIGGVIGAQFGARAGQNLQGEYLRFMLALLVLMVGVRFAVNLTLEPAERYSVLQMESGR